MTFGQYVHSHFDAIHKTLLPAAQANALDNLVLTKAFVQGAKLRIQSALHQGGGVTAPGLNAGDRKAKQKELLQLRQLHHNLENIDVYAIARPILEWNNLNADPIADLPRLRLQEEAMSVKTEADLERPETAAKSGWFSAIKKAVHWIRNRVDSTYIKAYSQEVAGLLTDGSETVEHFVVNSMIQLKNGSRSMSITPSSPNSMMSITLGRRTSLHPSATRHTASEPKPSHSPQIP